MQRALRSFNLRFLKSPGHSRHTIDGIHLSLLSCLTQESYLIQLRHSIIYVWYQNALRDEELLNRDHKLLIVSLLITAFGLTLASCASPSIDLDPVSQTGTEKVREGDLEHGHAPEAETLSLPELEAIDLDGQALKAIATTGVIGDVVAQVGGDSIALTTLMNAGQDPHSYQPAARDLTAVAGAHVIFVNGWDLEEALVQELEEISEDALFVPISAEIEPLTFGDAENQHENGSEEPQGEHEEHQGGEGPNEHHPRSVDPHVWFSIHNVEQWVENVEHVLSSLDPANAETYEQNARAYLAELEELEGYAESQLTKISPDKRILVTNHDSFSYFAEAYGFEVLGTVLPAASTLAEPSVSDLADLIAELEEHKVCTIFTETTVSDTLAQTVAAELEGCDDVKVLQLYSGALGPAGSGAESYIDMFRANVDTILAGLQ